MILIQIIDAEVHLGICGPCKQAKSRCRFEADARICKQCHEKGLQCVIEPPKPCTCGAWSNNISNKPSSSTNNVKGSSMAVKPTTQWKCSNLDTSSQTNCPPKQPWLISQLHTATLGSITEVNDEAEFLADTLILDFNIIILSAYDYTVPLISKAQFINALLSSL